MSNWWEKHGAHFLRSFLQFLYSRYVTANGNNLITPSYESCFDLNISFWVFRSKYFVNVRRFIRLLKWWILRFTIALWACVVKFDKIRPEINLKLHVIDIWSIIIVRSCSRTHTLMYSEWITSCPSIGWGSIWVVGLCLSSIQVLHNKLLDPFLYLFNADFLLFDIRHPSNIHHLLVRICHLMWCLIY